MNDDAIIIERFLNRLSEKLKANIPSATGRTAKSLEVAIQSRQAGSSGQLLGAPWIGALEYGRGPRRSDEDTAMWLNILAWMRARGIAGGADESAKARSITYMINLRGTKQYQLGKPSGIISDVINDKELRSLTRELGRFYTPMFTTEVLKGFKTIKYK